MHAQANILTPFNISNLPTKYCLGQCLKILNWLISTRYGKFTNLTQEIRLKVDTCFISSRVNQMKNKALELNLRQIMQGMEEFATFMSYQSNYEGLRILKVETQTADTTSHSSHITDNVIPLEQARMRRIEPANEVAVKKYH